LQVWVIAERREWGEEEEEEEGYETRGSFIAKRDISDMKPASKTDHFNCFNLSRPHLLNEIQQLW
jgi:hypothetical protein